MTAQAEDGKLDVKKALRVFQYIVDTGEPVDGQYHLEGLVADPGIDGYAIVLKNDYVRLDIQFHSNFTLYATSSLEQTRFLDKLDRLDKAQRA